MLADGDELPIQDRRGGILSDADGSDCLSDVGLSEEGMDEIPPAAESPDSLMDQLRDFLREDAALSDDADRAEAVEPPLPPPPMRPEDAEMAEAVELPLPPPPMHPQDAEMAERQLSHLHLRRRQTQKLSWRKQERCCPPAALVPSL